MPTMNRPRAYSIAVALAFPAAVSAAAAPPLVLEIKASLGRTGAKLDAVGNAAKKCQSAACFNALGSGLKRFANSERAGLDGAWAKATPALKNSACGKDVYHQMRTVDATVAASAAPLIGLTEANAKAASSAFDVKIRSVIPKVATLVARVKACAASGG